MLFGGRSAPVTVRPGCITHRLRLLLHADHRPVSRPFFFDALAPKAHQVVHGRDVLLIAFTIVGLMVGGQHQSYVRAHRNDRGITAPGVWASRGLAIRSVGFIRPRKSDSRSISATTQATGKSVEDISKEEFLASVNDTPYPVCIAYREKAPPWDFSRLWQRRGRHISEELGSHSKTQNPHEDSSTTSEHILCESSVWASGTLSASILFPTALVALFLLRREQKPPSACFSLPYHSIHTHLRVPTPRSALSDGDAGWLSSPCWIRLKQDSAAWFSCLPPSMMSLLQRVPHQA